MDMIFKYLFLIVVLTDVVFVGLLITYALGLKFFLEARLAAAALVGMVILGGLMLLISLFLGLNFWGLVIFLAALNLVGYKLLIKSNIEAIKDELNDFKDRFKRLGWKLYFLFVAFFMVVFGYLAFQLLTMDNGRYFVQPVHSYGDISLHLGFISSFAFGNNFPPQNPILTGTKISYPFLADFITAIFINPFSLRFDQAVALVGILLMGILVALLSFFALKITGSRLAACLTLILFFFNGGVGFFYFLYELELSNLSFLEFIQVLPRDYTALKELGFYWLNVVISMLLPQRSFLLGLPVAILIMYIFWDLSEHFNTKKLLTGVLLTSFLPIIHTHSLIALSPFLLWLTILVILKNRHRLKLFLISGFLGIAIIFILSKLFLQQIETPFSLMQYKLGWMATEGIIPFYFKNFGLNLVLIPAAIFFGIKRKLKIAYLALVGQLWFILPSLFIFQPWDFDNTKFFIYWYLSSIFIVAYFLSKLIMTRQITNTLLVGMAIYLLNFAGVLDVVRLISSSGTKFEIYSPQAIKFGEFVRSNTKPDAVFLSIDKFDNPVTTLAGRKVVVGYHGWLWTYGLDYSQRETDVRNMLAGQGTEDLFKKYGIDYVVFFSEQLNYEINETYFNQYKLIYDQDSYRVYQI